MNTSRWFRRLALAGLLLAFVVVVFGAYVRLTAAGLGCPDWPGCYGHVTPLGAVENADVVSAKFPGAEIDVGKAWREMIHRYAASTLGFIILIIAALAIVTRRERIVPVGFALGLLALVVFQGILGMLTVTWQLKPLIVTSHLVFGLATLSLLWWLWLSLRRRAGAAAAPPRARGLALVGLVALGFQIALGGWTSTNYAAVACPDLPTCQNEWVPQMDYDDAFVLWRGLGQNYEGGVLEHPARVAIHFTHRVGAIVATLALLLAAFFVLQSRAGPAPKRAAQAVLAALGLQLLIGILMVAKAFPLSLATAHNAGAALLLLATVLLNRELRPLPAVSMSRRSMAVG